MLSHMTTNTSNGNTISNDRVKPALTPDMLNFDANPSGEKYSNNKNYQYNNTNAVRNVKNNNHYNKDNKIDDNIDNKNNSLQETPSAFEEIKLRHNLNVKENNDENKENKSDDYVKDLINNENVNDHKDDSNNEQITVNKNEERSNNLTANDNANRIKESQQLQNEEKKMKFVNYKDAISDSSTRLNKVWNREKNHDQKDLNKFNYSINNNDDDSNYNSNKQNNNNNLDNLNSDKSRYISL